jgi:hypothetical protein
MSPPIDTYIVEANTNNVHNQIQKRINVGNAHYFSANKNLYIDAGVVLRFGAT